MTPRRVTVALLLATGACAGPRQQVSDAAAPGAGEFTLVVNNRHPLDVNVFLSRDSQADRVGTVSTATSETLVLPARMLGQGGLVRLIAEPIGADTRYTTEPVHLQPGQRLEVNVEAVISRSNYSVR
jgi:hypothetical protein